MIGDTKSSDAMVHPVSSIATCRVTDIPKSYLPGLYLVASGIEFVRELPNRLLKGQEILDDLDSPLSAETLLLRRLTASLADIISCTQASSRVPI